MRDRQEYRPLSVEARTGGAVRLLLGIEMVLLVSAAVGHQLDRDWWIAPVAIAAIIAVVVPPALWSVRRESTGSSLVVGRESVELVRRGRPSIVVDRQAGSYAATFAAVHRGGDSPSTDDTLLVTDGSSTIRLLDMAWGRDTLREIADQLDLPYRDGWTSRVDVMRSVGLEAAVWERRPVLAGVLLMLGVFVALAMATTVGVLLS